jgi:hypothetical protein
MLQPQLAQAHSDRINVVRRHRAGGKQRNLPTLALVMHLDGLAPCLALTGVNLPQVQHLALNDAPLAQASILDNVPIVVDLAVLNTSVAAQEHAQSL